MKTTNLKMTCQVCKRRMYANNGRISYHGWIKDTWCEGSGKWPLEAKQKTCVWLPQKKQWQIMDFKTLWKKGSKNKFRETLLSLDPGHTTGYALWSMETESPIIIKSGQIKTWADDDLVVNELLMLIQEASAVVLESYQIYDWKKDEHSWSQIPTVQVIGCIKTLCQLQAKPYYAQTAQVAKQFCTDERLEHWGMWKKGERHARDAIRHGCYWLLFGKTRP